MRRNPILTAMCSAAVMLLSVAVDQVFGAGAWAASIKLEDNTALTGDVLQMDDHRVIIGLPRETIATIDGNALPQVLTAGVAAPAFSAEDMSGQPQAVGGTNGRVTVLHFWVQWCPHCRSDAPQLQALYDAFRADSRVQILTVSLDQQRADVDQFITEHQVTYPVIFAEERAAAPGGVDLPELYQVTGFPVTYVIDAQGVIRQKVTGSFVESGQDLKALVSEMLPSSDR